MSRRLASWLSLGALALALGGCARQVAEPAGPSARARYNAALGTYAASEWDKAAEALLEARDQAGPDPELRFRAAFNLGLAQAAAAGATAAEAPEQAIEKLRQSAAWFQDAVRLAPEDEDARVNLELVLRRIQVLADELNKGKNSLEARLGRVIDDQRSLRDRVRQLMDRVDAAGVASEPVRFQAEYDEQAVLERTLLAEAGSVADLAAEELGLIEGKQPDERTQQEAMRLVQLENVGHYLREARQSLSDARRSLRKLEGDTAHRRADKALAELKRAREQLLDPVAVLKLVAEDASLGLRHTVALDALAKAAKSVKVDASELPKAPAWLTPGHLTDRLGDAAERTGEVLARFGAGVGAADQAAAQGQPGPAEPADPAQQRMLTAAREAMPLLEEAVGALGDANTAIGGSDYASASRREADALQALLRAIERFAGLRDLIELAYRDQSGVVSLLTSRTAEDGAELSTADRTRLLREAVGANRDRLRRLTGLFKEELAKLEAGDAAAPPQGGPAGAVPAPAPAPDPKQTEALKQRFAKAEELRADAARAVDELGRALERLGGEGPPPLPPARQALGKLEDLRRLFFSIVEHLKELLAKQSETHDSTASAQLAPESEREALFGPLVEAEDLHATLAAALADALAAQADAAAAAQDPQAQEGAKALAEAAPEVKTAGAEMGDALAQLRRALAQVGQVSTDLEPALEHQRKAMDHLETAIQLLEPHAERPQPPQEQQSDDQQKQQQQQQQEQQEQEQVSQRQAERRLQAIRDRDAERQRERERRQGAASEPVEKDW